MTMLLISLAFAHDFSPIAVAPPSLPQVKAGEPTQALQLMMLAFMPDAERFATLDRLRSQERTKRVEVVFAQCDVALRDGVRPGEAGFAQAAKRQQKGLVFDCIEAAAELAKVLGVDDRKSAAAEALSPGARQPRFGVSSCPPLMSTLDVTVPGPLQPRKLPKRGEHSRYGSAVVHIDGAGAATVKGRLYGDEAASRACWAAVDGPWRQPVDGDGKPTENCFHLRCAW